MTIGGCSVEDLGLDFTLPGDPSWELKPGGGDIAVTIDNLEEYLQLVLEQHTVHGIAPQVTAFRAGFNAVFPVDNLRIFSPLEVQHLLSGAQTQQNWDVQSMLLYFCFLLLSRCLLGALLCLCCCTAFV